MRTTIRIDDDLLIEAKQYAARLDKTLTSVIEDALRETLARQITIQSRSPVHLTTVKGRGTLPGVDLDDSADLLSLMEEPLDPP